MKLGARGSLLDCLPLGQGSISLRGVQNRPPGFSKSDFTFPQVKELSISFLFLTKEIDI